MHAVPRHGPADDGCRRCRLVQGAQLRGNLPLAPPSQCLTYPCDAFVAADAFLHCLRATAQEMDEEHRRLLNIIREATSDSRIEPADRIVLRAQVVQWTNSHRSTMILGAAVGLRPDDVICRSAVREKLDSLEACRSGGLCAADADDAGHVVRGAPHWHGGAGLRCYGPTAPIDIQYTFLRGRIPLADRRFRRHESGGGLGAAMQSISMQCRRARGRSQRACL
jgi:hypothetical protein